MRAGEITWEELSDAAERQFGHATARVYPFISIRTLSRRPLVRTPSGPGRIISVMAYPRFNDGEVLPTTEDLVEVVLESDPRFSEKPQYHRFRPEEIEAPLDPPPRWAANVFGGHQYA